MAISPLNNNQSYAVEVSQYPCSSRAPSSGEPSGAPQCGESSELGRIFERFTEIFTHIFDRLTSFISSLFQGPNAQEQSGSGGQQVLTQPQQPVNQPASDQTFIDGFFDFGRKFFDLCSDAFSQGGIIDNLRETGSSIVKKFKFW